MKVLLSAYACEPNRGSEPGVGWEWANRLAQHHQVTVITRKNNRAAIGAALGEEWRPGQPRFVYVDLPGWVLWLKKVGICRVFVYYMLWQLVARVAASRLLVEVDLVHHITFNSFRFPGAWWFVKKPVLLGPLGGTSIAQPQFKRCFGSWWPMEWLRGMTVRCWRWNPWTRLSLCFCSAVLTVDAAAEEWFSKSGRMSLTMLETALPMGLESEQMPQPSAVKKDFLWVGTIEPWKAWQIAFEAFAMARRDGMQGQRLVVIGTGRQHQLARARARELGIAEVVDFLGMQTREEVWNRMRLARGLIFSSVRDTSGNVVLEAMGLGCPVVCFRHQGAALMTDDACALRVLPRGWDQSVADFSAAMVRLAADDGAVAALGEAGQKRAVESFTWLGKIRKMTRLYEEVLSKWSCTGTAVQRR